MESIHAQRKNEHLSLAELNFRKKSRFFARADAGDSSSPS